MVVFRRPSGLLLLFCAVAFMSGSVTVVEGAERRPMRTELETTREEILASRQKRSKQIETMLEDSKQRLADHNNGLRVLSDKDKEDLDKKVNIYQRKLDTMQGDLDEREIERILKREQLRDARVKERRERRSEL